MLSVSLHKEDIKATLRKRHGTVDAFAKSRNLKPQAVADWLRGRTNAVVERAVKAEMQSALGDHQRSESIILDDSAEETSAHRLNAGAR